MGILQGTWISSTFINKHAVIFGYAKWGSYIDSDYYLCGG
jgi:hypothetical protein